MKAYKKPKLMVLSISANDALCAGCGKATRGDPLFDILDNPPTGNNDGVFNKQDPIFASGEECTCTGEYTEYCKFTGAENGLTQLFTS